MPLPRLRRCSKLWSEHSADRRRAKRRKNANTNIILLRSLAYDAALFKRCVGALVTVITAEARPPKGTALKVFASLFHLVYLRHPMPRLNNVWPIIESLLTDPEEKKRELGVLALKAVLEAGHFLAASKF